MPLPPSRAGAVASLVRQLVQLRDLGGDLQFGHSFISMRGSNMQVGIFDLESSTDGRFTMQIFQCPYNKRAAVADGSGGRLTESAALVPCWYNVQSRRWL